MTISKLSYLRVVHPEISRKPALSRPADLNDLVEVLKEHGALERDCSEIIDHEGRLVGHPGRYLIMPLDGHARSSDG